MGETILVDDAYTDDRFDFSGTRAFDESTGYRSQSFLTVPLKPRGKEVLGVIQLLNAKDPDTGDVISFDPEIVGFVEALASQAAVALDNQSLIEAQKELLDSFIELIAGAIDAKSPYTGGHCNRVPELAMMLAEAAVEKSEGPFSDFMLANEDEWREFRIGAWLHDCGKVTTPEYVVDKATKLETIYNRIHEIRTRFEVLLRDARIDILERKLAGESIEESEFEERRSLLMDEFEFLAECNIGGEFMSEERMNLVQEIGAQPWTRNFDDRIGLSATELERYREQPKSELPVQEKLLADRPEHIVGRDDPDPFGSNPYGFKMDVPKHLYNYGEVYNLCITKGTLTEEERYKINEHIIQTINMLNALPYPKHLERVPEIAANHHETMIGTGYPRRLSKEDMSVPSRIMAIADIFEALTASDRPYKSPKALSEAIKIMSFMRNDQHIDPDLFDLFLESGVYQQYAERFLGPEQTDVVDIGLYVSNGTSSSGRKP
jgi:HD-GYP domain-containing protein (c-di-GMP phosphodiesterase class II)